MVEVRALGAPCLYRNVGRQARVKLLLMVPGLLGLAILAPRGVAALFPLPFAFPFLDRNAGPLDAALLGADARADGSDSGDRTTPVDSANRLACFASCSFQRR